MKRSKLRASLEENLLQSCSESMKMNPQRNCLEPKAPFSLVILLFVLKKEELGDLPPRLLLSWAEEEEWRPDGP